MVCHRRSAERAALGGEKTRMNPMPGEPEFKGLRALRYGRSRPYPLAPSGRRRPMAWAQDEHGGMLSVWACDLLFDGDFGWLRRTVPWWEDDGGDGRVCSGVEL